MRSVLEREVRLLNGTLAAESVHTWTHWLASPYLLGLWHNWNCEGNKKQCRLFWRSCLHLHLNVFLPFCYPLLPCTRQKQHFHQTWLELLYNNAFSFWTSEQCQDKTLHSLELRVLTRWNNLPGAAAAVHSSRIKFNLRNWLMQVAASELL